MTTNYIQEIFLYYKSKNLRNPPHSSLNLSHLNKILSWLYNFSEINNLPPEIFQLSIEIFNTFLSKNPLSSPNHYLVSMTCLLIASKYAGNFHLSLSQVLNYCSNHFLCTHLRISEIFILQTLNWQISIPIGSEVLRVLLLATGVKSDLKKVFERADAFVVSCYVDGRFFEFSAVEIAVVSVVCALEQFSQRGFRNQWVCFVVGRMEMDVDRLDRCKAVLVEKLILSTPVNDINKIECLTRESISRLISGKLK